MKVYVVCLWIGVLLASCSRNERLEYALEFAGSNRAELEKVLEHYADSGLKYEAACFLIENMPRYYAYKGEKLDSLREVQASIYYKKILSNDLKKRWSSFAYQNQDRVYDAHVMTADYLIENIDMAFATWQERPWKQAVSFDEFCEWILPYRIGDEPLENWRKAYYQKYSVMLDSMYQGRDVVVAADSLMRRVTKEGWVYNEELTLPRLGPLFLLKHCVGTCRETCDYTAYILRSVGIPVGTDLIHSSLSGGGHQWSVLKDTTGGVVPFWLDSVVRGVDDGRQKGKVFRMCFGTQKEKIPGMLIEKEIPSILKDLYQKDVTKDYFGENSVEVEVESEACGNYVYLGVFSPSGWVPIDIVPSGKGKAVMKNVEEGVVYVPLSSKEGGRLQAVGHPFWLTNGKVSYFRPERKQVKVELLRKHPLGDWTRRHMERIVGSRIEASNTPGFHQSEMLYQIVDTPKVNYNVVYCSPKQKYRYVRFTAAKDQLARVAELMFYRSASDGVKMKVKVVAGSEPDDDDEDVVKEKVCDGDYLTYFLSDTKGGFVTLDLGKPERIEKLVYIPRNDENFISIGHDYELFYQDGANGWKTLGRKKGMEPRLVYDNVPGDVLLWLRNLTTGKEEQVFIMRDGKQLFVGKIG